ncbi:MAG: helix-turn-helix transcriptional regulator, partial [Xanthomonadales bacterium]|nr:helix-turn-helix transcriptional regulator [Xanthomonadales bacterium]
AAWIAVFATRATWRQLLAPVAGEAAATLVPATHAASPGLRRIMLAMARAARAQSRSTATPSTDLLLDFAQALADVQTAFDAMIARCPGRSLAQRRAVFARLQRVRRYMHANSHLDLDTVALAKRANYSLSHFIRSYRRVFDETPHAALVASRLERAHAMLGNSALAVGEVALASGFENRCAFSRVFKRHFGVTAQDVRRAVAA